LKKRIIVTVCSLLIVLVSYTNLLDDVSNDYTNNALENAVITFAAARTLNGVISVVQGTEVSVSPAGVGMNLSMGEILNPVNDLIERFSWVMLASITSLGIQKILISIGFNLILSISVAIFIFILWSPRLQKNNALAVSAKIVLGVLLIRYALVTVILSNQLVYSQFMSEEYDTATNGLEIVAGTVGEIEARSQDVKIDSVPDEEIEESSAEENKKSIFSSWGEDESSDIEEGSAKDDPNDAGMVDSAIAKMNDLWGSAISAINPIDRISELRESVANAVSYIFKLIVVFLLQTILIPIAFLWCLYKVFLLLMRTDKVDVFFASEVPESAPAAIASSEGVK